MHNFYKDLTFQAHWSGDQIQKRTSGGYGGCRGDVPPDDNDVDLLRTCFSGGLMGT